MKQHVKIILSKLIKAVSVAETLSRSPVNAYVIKLCELMCSILFLLIYFLFNCYSWFNSKVSQLSQQLCASQVQIHKVGGFAKDRVYSHAIGSVRLYLSTAVL